MSAENKNLIQMMEEWAKELPSPDMVKKVHACKGICACLGTCLGYLSYRVQQPDFQAICQKETT